jgi:orotidine-5'-phosphate decarboxylase
VSRATLTARERVIVALDVPDLKEAEVFLDRLEGRPAFYKVGLELFVAEGERAIQAVRKRGGRVFLDLKLHDIPETVARAVQSARAMGAELLTIHAGGGAEMVKRAAEAAGGELKILAVTVLTSLSGEDLERDGIAGTVADAVSRRGRLAVGAGAAGLVCSPREVSMLREAVPNALLVVPGIRPAGAALGDQKRVGTPAEAIAAGADHLVVGRPIRDAANPAQAFTDIVQEIEKATL